METLALDDGRTGPLTPILSLILLVGTFVAAALHYAWSMYYARPYPWYTFLFRPIDRRMDFFNDCQRAVDYGTGGNRVPSTLLAQARERGWRS